MCGECGNINKRLRDALSKKRTIGLYKDQNETTEIDCVGFYNENMLCDCHRSQREKRVGFRIKQFGPGKQKPLELHVKKFNGGFHSPQCRGTFQRKTGDQSKMSQACRDHNDKLTNFASFLRKNGKLPKMGQRTCEGVLHKRCGTKLEREARKKYQSMSAAFKAKLMDEENEDIIRGRKCERMVSGKKNVCGTCFDLRNILMLAVKDMRLQEIRSEKGEENVKCEGVTWEEQTYFTKECEKIISKGKGGRKKTKCKSCRAEFENLHKRKFNDDFKAKLLQEIKEFEEKRREKNL